VTIRVVVVDDHDLIRHGLRGFIESAGDMVVVGEASSVREAIDRISATQPDVAILDVRLEDGDGVELCREIRSRWPRVRCLFLTSFPDDDVLFNAIMAGAAGFLVKRTRASEVVDAVRRVASGESLLDPTVTERVLDRLRGVGQGGEPHLTDREERILGLIAEGLTNRQIGQRVHLAEKTVKNHVTNLMAKLGVQHRTQAAIYATRRGHARAVVVRSSDP
jgi:two-component system response regulator DevR